MVRVPHCRSEPELRAAVAHALRASGIAVEEDVPCSAGEADLVSASREIIYEIKHRLTRKALQHAAGQLLLYRTSINPEARLAIVGYATLETSGLIPHLADLGIDVICWQDRGVSDDGNEEREGEGSSQPSSRIPPRSLIWRVQESATDQGIMSAAALARAVGSPRGSLSGLWNGTAATISLTMLEKIARVLMADPGDWFRWEGDRLAWNIATIAQNRLGITAMNQFGFAAGIYPRMIALYWRGETKFVFVETLARLAIALNTEAKGFALGDLFQWAKDGKLQPER